MKKNSMDSPQKLSELKRDYFLTAGETDAEGKMPMSLIFERSIEVATEHANALGIGYSTLIKRGVGWVLTRMSVQMLRYPGINESYSFITWIESYNRLYSDRCFLIIDADGNTIGHARSMWVAIDMNKRTAADLSEFERDSFPIGPRKCPLPMQRKLGALTGAVEEREYTFRFSDIDFNRHVNTIQYVRAILNQWSLPFFDEHQIAEIEVAFHSECHFGDTVLIRVERDTPLEAVCEITNAGHRAVAAKLRFEKRNIN